MIIHIFPFFAVVELVFSESCDWIDAITIRKADIKARGSGLHRSLSVDLNIGSSNRFVDCLIAYEFTIPAGAYVNFDSMKEYPTHTYIEASFDIEASREESENTSFHICSKRGLNKNFVYSEHFELPIHLRYHAASGKDAVVVVPPPQLLLRCFENSTFLTSDCKKYLVKASCDCSSESRCEWLMIPLLKYNEVQFRIPTGNVSSLKFVLFVTVSIVISCALAIIIATMKNVVKAKVE